MKTWDGIVWQKMPKKCPDTPPASDNEEDDKVVWGPATTKGCWEHLISKPGHPSKVGYVLSVIEGDPGMFPGPRVSVEDIVLEWETGRLGEDPPLARVGTVRFEPPSGWEQRLATEDG